MKKSEIICLIDKLLPSLDVTVIKGIKHNQKENYLEYKYKGVLVAKVGRVAVYGTTAAAPWYQVWHISEGVFIQIGKYINGRYQSYSSCNKGWLETYLMERYREILPTAKHNMPE